MPWSNTRDFSIIHQHSQMKVAIPALDRETKTSIFPSFYGRDTEVSIHTPTQHTPNGLHLFARDSQERHRCTLLLSKAGLADFRAGLPYQKRVFCRYFLLNLFHPKTRCQSHHLVVLHREFLLRRRRVLRTTPRQKATDQIRPERPPHWDTASRLSKTTVKTSTTCCN